ncbi:hypothetical protein CTKZ_08540 [Cellulomonas algicola]|uniref:Uncharacterized protein n=1 Tax=Cellulomonas algicola TaxID=2071633 RepID=A0A401UXD2_9CELL|nr:hypothetical protein [Cellulomonas algicola]GCD19292.1 hypothetical protein CTKZ_08540 [Cellulomonas algicola]
MNDDHRRPRPTRPTSPERASGIPDDVGCAHEVAFETDQRLADIRAAMAASKAEITDAARRLGVDARQLIPAAPWVITGTVDDRAFYMRERGDQYTIVIASDEEPTVQPWGRPDARAITVRTGDADDIYIGTPPDYGRAMDFIVGVIRQHLRRASCPHPHRSGDRYCAACGIAFDDADV